MRNVSKQLIERINDYVFKQKVSLEAVLVLIDMDIRIYSEEIREHLKKYIKYIIWLDDNHKDTKNSWEKYIDRLEWLENKDKKIQDNSTRMDRIVHDLEEKEAFLKQKKENEMRIDSISKGFWKEKAELEKENQQLSFEEVILSNGETVITTLIEEPVELLTHTDNEMNLNEDDYLNTILTEDIFEENVLEKIMQPEVFEEPSLKDDNVIKSDAHKPFNEEDHTNKTILNNTQNIDFKTESVKDLTSDEILDILENRLENPNPDSYEVNDNDIKSEYDIATSDYFMFDPTHQNADLKTDSKQNIVKENSDEQLNENTYNIDDSVPSKLFTEPSLITTDENKNDTPFFEKIEDEAFEDTSYLTIKKFDETKANEFILNDEEKTLFTSSNDDGDIDQSMFEDSTLQTFAEDNHPTLDAFEFLNNLEEKYSTLLEFNPDEVAETYSEIKTLQERTTNTLDALKFVDEMDSKYADLLTDDPDDLSEVLEDIE